MKFNKVKEMLKDKNINFKNKKVQLISAAVAGALIIAVTGTMVLNNNNIENKTVTIENNIEENKEELAVENTDEHIHNENCNHDNENSTSQGVAQNSNTDKQESTTESSDKKVSTTTQTSTNNSSKVESSSSKPSSTTTNQHTHSWVEVYKDVHHAEEGHWENILVKEAWTESVPVYENQVREICNDCGADITDLSESDYEAHMTNHILNGGKGSWRTEYKQVQTGTNTIKHDAVYEKKWVVDKQAWTEKVLSGYKCNSCGATK
ncbi:MAG: hypothetical protein NSGCLCUN01_03719 [uncultured Clostridium sp.]